VLHPCRSVHRLHARARGEASSPSALWEGPGTPWTSSRALPRALAGLSEDEIGRRARGFRAIVRGISEHGAVSPSALADELGLEPAAARELFAGFATAGVEVDGGEHPRRGTDAHEDSARSSHGRAKVLCLVRAGHALHPRARWEARRSEFALSRVRCRDSSFRCSAGRGRIRAERRRALGVPTRRFGPVDGPSESHLKPDALFPLPGGRGQLGQRS
jgi:hypothetical protein